MAKIIYTNSKGEQLTIAPSPPIILQEKEGFSAVDNIITSTQNHDADGEIFVSAKLAVRNLFIRATVLGKNEEDYLKIRRNVTRILNPKLAGTLRYITKTGEYDIDVIPELAPAFSESDGGIHDKPFEISLKALDPYWTDKSLIDGAVPLSIVIPEWSFPLEVTDTFEFATIDSGSIVNVENNGDIPVGATFNIRFGADVINPRVYNVLTQEFFGMSGTYSSGSEVRISTMRGKKKVEQNDGSGWYNAMTKRLTGSTFLQLVEGVNSLQMQADSGVENTVATVEYEPKIVGV